MLVAMLTERERERERRGCYTVHEHYDTVGLFLVVNDEIYLLWDLEGHTVSDKRFNVDLNVWLQ